jgi:hypothetical protein
MEARSHTQNNQYSDWLHRRLREQAKQSGCTLDELILAGIATVVAKPERAKPKSVKVRFPLIVSSGPKINLTNENIYRDVDFP